VYTMLDRHTQTDRQIHRQIDRHRHTTGLHSVYTMLYRHTDRQTDRQTQTHRGTALRVHHAG